MAGYEITRAENGDEALEAALATPFDLAVLDIMVPGISGIEVLEELRQQRPDIAVIMLSALEDEATQLRAFNLCADDYVAKPFSPILLLIRIETILRRVKTAIPEGSIREENDNKIRLSAESYEAYYEGKSLGLTLSEFLLLQAHRVIYNNNPILKWCLTNTGIQTDRNGNIVPIKNQSPRQRIDGAAALLDCYVGLYEHYNEFINAI